VIVTLYTRAGCHLCEVARGVVERVAAGRAEVELVDIDTDPQLLERYTVRVPVVAVDGREIAEYEVDAAQLEAALAGWRRR
jgi:glutaredoxin